MASASAIRADTVEFQRLMYEELEPRRQGIHLRAAVLLLLDGLILGLLAVHPAAPVRWYVVVLVVLLLAAVASAAAGWPSTTPVVVTNPDLASYEAYRALLRGLSPDAVLEEIARRTWGERESIRAREQRFRVALVLTIVALAGMVVVQVLATTAAAEDLEHMAIDPDDIEIPGFAGGGRVLNDGLAVVHKDEYIMPAPGSEAEIAPVASPDGDVVNYYFPVEVVIVGTLPDDEVARIEARIWEQLRHAIARLT